MDPIELEKIRTLVLAGKSDISISEVLPYSVADIRDARHSLGLKKKYTPIKIAENYEKIGVLLADKGVSYAECAEKIGLERQSGGRTISNHIKQKFGSREDFLNFWSKSMSSDVQQILFDLLCQEVGPERLKDLEEAARRRALA